MTDVQSEIKTLEEKLAIAPPYDIGVLEARIRFLKKQLVSKPEPIKVAKVEVVKEPEKPEPKPIHKKTETHKPKHSKSWLGP
jgi:hypothetical protein